MKKNVLLSETREFKPTFWNTGIVWMVAFTLLLLLGMKISERLGYSWESQLVAGLLAFGLSALAPYAVRMLVRKIRTHQRRFAPQQPMDFVPS